MMKRYASALSAILFFLTVSLAHAQTWAPPIENAAGSTTPLHVFSADLTGTQKSDVLSISQDHTLLLYVNDGSGRLTLAPAPLMSSVISATAGKFSGSTMDDVIAIARKSGSPQLDILTSLGNRAFASPRPIPVPAALDASCQVATADFNGDGHPDILIACFDRGLLLQGINDGTGKFKFSSIPHALGGGRQIVQAVPGDIDGDGLADIVVQSHTAYDPSDIRVDVLRNNGDGQFVPHLDYMPVSSETSIAAFQIAGHASSNLVTASADSLTVYADGADDVTSVPLQVPAGCSISAVTAGHIFPVKDSLALDVVATANCNGQSQFLVYRNPAQVYAVLTPTLTYVAGVPSLSFKVNISSSTGNSIPTGTVTIHLNGKIQHESLADGTVQFQLRPAPGMNMLRVAYGGDPYNAGYSETVDVVLADPNSTNSAGPPLSGKDPILDVCRGENCSVQELRILKPTTPSRLVTPLKANILSAPVLSESAPTTDTPYEVTTIVRHNPATGKNVAAPGLGSVSFSDNGQVKSAKMKGTTVYGISSWLNSDCEIAGTKYAGTQCLADGSGSYKIAYEDDSVSYSGSLKFATSGEHQLTAAYTPASEGSATLVQSSTVNVSSLKPEFTTKPLPKDALSVGTISCSPASSTFGTAVVCSIAASCGGVRSADRGSFIVYTLAGVDMCGGTVTNGAGHCSGELPVGSRTVYGSVSLSCGSSGNTSNTSITITKVTPSATVSTSNGSIAYGQSVTFTATVTGPGGVADPSGTVTFLANGSSIGTGTLSGGTASFGTSTMGVGSYTITVQYGGDANYNAKTSAGITQTVNKAGSSLTVNDVNPNPTTYSGGAETLGALISNGQNGTVSFFANGSAACSAGSSGSQAYCNWTPPTAGSYNITASWPGNGNYNGSGSNIQPLTVNQVASSTTVSCAPNALLFGQTTVCTAHVTTGVGAPTGTVEMYINGNPSENGTLSGGVATFTNQFEGAPINSYSVSATYSGDTDHASSSGNTTVTVSQAPTSIDLTASSSAITAGASDTFTATISSGQDGTVTFYDGGTSIGTATSSGSIATFTDSTLAVGSHSITASWPGNADFTGATSTAVSVTVSNPSTSTFVWSTENPVPVGSVAQIFAEIPIGGATGSVDFTVDGSAAGSPSVANFTATNLLPNSNNFSAWSNAGNVTLTQNVTAPDGSTTAWLDQANSSNSIQQSEPCSAGPVTYSLFAEQVASNPVASITISRTYFDSSDTIIGSAALSPIAITSTWQRYFVTAVAPANTASCTTAIEMPGATAGNGVNIWDAQIENAGSTGPYIQTGTSSATGTVSIASIPVSLTSTGNHSVVAQYSGDGTYTASTSDPFPLVASGAASVSTLSSSPNPSSQGQSVTFSDLISTGGYEATGSVPIAADGTSIGSTTLGSASATNLALDSNLNLGMGGTFSAWTHDSSGGLALSVIPQAVPGPIADGTYAAQVGYQAVPAGDFLDLKQLFSFPVIGNTYTLSVWLKAEGTPATVQLLATEQCSPFTGASSTPLAITTSWQRFSVTGTVGGSSSCNDLTVDLRSPAGTAAQTVDVYGVQLEQTGSAGPLVQTGLAQRTASGAIASLSYSALAVGNHTMTAPYPGDLIALGSNAPAITQVVTLNASTVTLASSSNPSSYGSAVTFTATVPAGATGTVAFTSDGVSMGAPVAVSSGTASILDSALTGGSHSIVASYSGDVNYAAATSTTLTQVVNTVASTNTLASSINPSNYQQSIALTDTVNNGATGTVTFYDGATSLGTATVSAGAAAISIATLSAGTHSLTAQYSGDSNYAPSTSNTVSQIVDKAVPIVGISSSLNPSTIDATVTFTATVPSYATGSVQFFDGGKALGAPATISGGSASLSISSLTVGTHSIVAAYPGDANDGSGASATLSQVVGKAASTTALTTSNASSIFLNPVTFTATVSSSPAATGTVSFYDGATWIGTAPVTAGVASIPITTLAAGMHSISAVYSGDGNVLTSTSNIVSQDVAQSPSGTTLASSLNPSPYSENVTFAATIPSVATGTVQFYDGATLLGTSNVAGGSATLAINSLAQGTHSITAVYSGDANYLGGTSAPLSQVVAPSGTVSQVFIAPSNSVTYGTNVTFSALVHTAAFNPTGTVTFYDGATSLGTSPVTEISTTNLLSYSSDFTKWTPEQQGAAAATLTPAIATGPDGSTNTASTLTLPDTSSGGSDGSVYSGIALASYTGNYAADPMTFSVWVKGTAGTSIALYLTDGSGVPEGTQTCTLAAIWHRCTLTSTFSGGAAPGFAAHIRNWGGSATTISLWGAQLEQAASAGPYVLTYGASSTGNGGSAVFSTASLTQGPHAITAQYSGDSNYSASTSNPKTVTVSQASSATALVSSLNPSTPGSSVAFIATVTGAGIQPTGTVQFMDGTTPLGAPVALNASGTATFSTSSLGTGAYSITAIYGGDANHLPSTSAAVNQVVGKLTAAIHASSSFNPSVFGETVTFHVSITGSGAVPTGSVTVLDGARPIGTASLDSIGNASIQTDTLPAGTHNLTIAYSGDPNYL